MRVYTGLFTSMRRELHGRSDAGALISCVIRRNVKRKLKPIDRVIARPDNYVRFASPFGGLARALELICISVELNRCNANYVSSVYFWLAVQRTTRRGGRERVREQGGRGNERAGSVAVSGAVHFAVIRNNCAENYSRGQNCCY